MRPLRLEIEGFTAFREPVCLDLSQLDLFAITGPTGAGKSSLIDAVSYALYGRIPRVSNEVASCISQGLDRMLVGLEFMAAEERYRVFRETRRKGQGNIRLERWTEEGWQALEERATAVNAEVSRIVGLDYDGFTRSVLLPQGQFQEFLAGSADKRRAVLASLLRLQVYESMRRRAAGIANELKTRIDERQNQLATLAEATPENVDRLETDLLAAVNQSEVLQVELKSLENGVALAIALKQARESFERCETEALHALAEFQKTRRVIDEGADLLEGLQKQVESLQAQLAANAYDGERHNALGIALERARAVEQVQAGIEQAARAQADASKQLMGAAAAVEKATQAHEAAQAALEQATATREEAQRHNLVAAIQHGLKPGDPCPVCDGKIGVLTAVDATAFDAADKRLALARKQETEARASLTAAAAAASKAAAVAESSGRQLVDLKARLVIAQSGLAEVLPEGDAAAPQAIEAVLHEQLQARTERLDLDAQLKQASEQSLALRQQRDEAERHLAALEQRLQTAADARVGAETAAVAARAALVTAASAWREVGPALESGADATPLVRRRLEEAQARQAAAVRSIGQLEVRIEHLKAEVERAAGLRASLDGLRQEHNVSADLAQMLGAAKFQTYVQQEALQTLAAFGSKRLEQLSAGRYRLQLDEKGAEFEVIDQWNADMARSVRTLSGGETFLASLALSLALAESLPGLAASRRVVLDSIFLDEGFGSLDADALDRAADALDALRAEQRMVCIVTHLPELAQRLPARLVVTKTESGSSVEIA